MKSTQLNKTKQPGQVQAQAQVQVKSETPPRELPNSNTTNNNHPNVGPNDNNNNNNADAIENISVQSDSIANNNHMYSSTSSINSNHVLTPVLDFQKSIENEKNLRKYINGLENITSPTNLNNDKIIQIIEKNYKLQIQTLLEEVNQLKLDKKLLEKRLDLLVKNKSMKSISDNTSIKTTRQITPIKNANYENLMITLDAKQSITKELEYQLQELKAENAKLLRIQMLQKEEIERLTDELAEKEDIRNILDENMEEIQKLKERLLIEEEKNIKLIQEIQLQKNENIALRIKSQNNSYCNINPNTNPNTNNINNLNLTNIKDQPSFIYTNADIKQQSNYKTFAEMIPNLGISQISDIQQINDNLRDTTTPRSVPKIKCMRRNASQNSKQFKCEYYDDDEPSLLEGLKALDKGFSMKTLKEYENELKTNNGGSINSGGGSGNNSAANGAHHGAINGNNNHQIIKDNDNKTLNRLIELKKIKNFYIQNENKRLMDMLDKMKKKNDSQIITQHSTINLL